MDIRVSHAPSTCALKIHAVLMFFRVVEVDVSSILKICVRAVCRHVDWCIAHVVYRCEDW